MRGRVGRGGGARRTPPRARFLVPVGLALLGSMLVAAAAGSGPEATRASTLPGGHPRIDERTLTAAVHGTGTAATTVASAAAAGAALADVVADAATPVQVAFTHHDHVIVACTSCHTSTDTHGATTVRTITDCRNCHHTALVSDHCARCHSGAETPQVTYTAVRSVSFSVGTSHAARELSFPHPAHASLDCAACHTQGLALAVPATLDCTSCHEQHHTPETRCASCHTQPPVAAHPPSEAHVTCSGAACHQEVPFETVPRTRAFCLACHQDLFDHEPGGRCADCHQLPAPRPGGG